ncbi:MAG: hypothetical protein J6A97_00755 [Clostridia bacterium]|nr:hypothetical protein [Clostridia bacterium]
MQRNEVKAFRQRLVRAGFTDICIYEQFTGDYIVSCRSSTGDRINKVMTIAKMNNTPRVVWFD